jgi:hypothetical protein
MTPGYDCDRLMRMEADRYMIRTSTALTVSALLCAWALPASAEETTRNAPVFSVTMPTPQQFDAMPPDAVLDINGKPVTKRELLARKQQTYDATMKRAQVARERAEAEFAAHRKAVLDAQEAKLKENNQQVQAEIGRLVAADNAAHGPDWQARRKRAADLLQQAAKASSPQERERLETRAADLVLTPARQ